MLLPSIDARNRPQATIFCDKGSFRNAPGDKAYLAVSMDRFAARPAPIQVSFVGYAGTMGAPYYDHIVTDATAAPTTE